MKKVWLSGGQLVINQGAIVLCEECPCEPVIVAPWWCIEPPEEFWWCMEEPTETGTGTEAATGTGTSTGTEQVDTGTGTQEVIPGDDCATGPQITLGNTYGPFTTSPSASHWFKATVAGVYHVEVEIFNEDGAFLSVWRGSCASPNLEFDDDLSTIGTYCNSASETGTIFIQVEAPVTEGTTYTVKVASGACPP